ncbi:MAG: hypothetical protein ACE5J9_01580, partial [Methanosarcinales archaeon]
MSISYKFLIITLFLFLSIFECSASLQNSEQIKLINKIFDEGPAYAVEVQGNYAYIYTGVALLIFKVSDPENPKKVGKVDLTELEMVRSRDVLLSIPSIATVGDLFITDNYAYVASGGGNRGLIIVDISDPEHPKKVGQFQTENSARDVFVEGDYAYLAAGELYVIDISTPFKPKIIQKVKIKDEVNSVEVYGNYAYIAGGRNGLVIMDISNKESIKIISVESGVTRYAIGVALNNNYAYVAAGALYIIDISNPYNPKRVGYYNPDNKGIAYNVEVDGSYAYITGGTDRLYIVNVSEPENPEQVKKLYIGGKVKVFEVALNNNYAYVSGWFEGLYIIDIRDPKNAIIVGQYDTISYIFDVAIKGNYAYVVSPLDGFYIVDISNPVNPILVGKSDVNGMKVEVSGNYAYLGSGKDGLYIINISDPKNPKKEGKYSTIGTVLDLAVKDNYVYIADGSQGFGVLDVSTPYDPRKIEKYLLDKANWEFGVSSVAVYGDYVYVASSVLHIFYIKKNLHKPKEVGTYHSINGIFEISVFGNYAYITNGKMGFEIINVSKPEKPKKVKEFNTAPGSAFEIAVSGNYAYVTVADKLFVSGKTLHSIYDGGALYVMDISNPENIKEVGKYKFTSRAYGVSVYKDYIYVADINKGLCILNISTAPTTPITPKLVSEPKVSIKLITKLFEEGPAYTVDFQGNYAYIYTGTGLLIFDISETENPKRVGQYDISDSTIKIIG